MGYRCGTCQSEVLVIEAFPKLDEMPAAWVLEVGNPDWPNGDGPHLEWCHECNGSGEVE